MSDELKSCPFDGLVAEEYVPGWVCCEENLHGQMPIEDWQNRPIEDALRAENEQLRAKLDQVQEEIKLLRAAIKFSRDVMSSFLDDLQDIPLPPGIMEKWNER